MIPHQRRLHDVRTKTNRLLKKYNDFIHYLWIILSFLGAFLFKYVMNDIYYIIL